MKGKIKFRLLQVVSAIILILLIYGAFNGTKGPKKTEGTYEKETFDKLETVPEYYSENQLAFIFWENMYEYYKNIDEAERCKLDLSNFLIENEPGKRVWIVQGIERTKTTLMFQLVNYPLTYQVKLNSNNMIIYKQE